MTILFFHKPLVKIIGAKAIGTAWTIAPSEEEESIWGGKTLTKGNCTLFNKLTIVKLSMTMRESIHYACFHVICGVWIILGKSCLLEATVHTVHYEINYCGRPCLPLNSITITWQCNQNDYDNIL